MAHQPRKTSRWPIALTEALLLQCLLVVSAHATAVDSIAATSAVNAANTGPSLTIDALDMLPVIDGNDLYLSVKLNGTDRGLAHFGYRDGQLWASQATLRRIGFKLAEGLPDPLQPSSLPGVQVNYSQQLQNITITAPLSALLLSTQILNTREAVTPKASAAPGMLLNYNLYGSQGEQGSGNLSAYTELRAFNKNSVLSSTALSQLSRSNQGWNNGTVRLDTTWSTSLPEHLLTLNVGDTLTAATSWSRPTRIGGIQIGTNFSLQPYRITTPLPQFIGSATLPSQVELYVNGLKQYASEVPAGPFQLNAIPGINGSGKAQVVLTNVLGQITTLDFSLYNTQQLLRKGLTDWSAELGYVRENYGQNSFDYGRKPMVSGTFRRGFSDTFTGETHGEATAGLFNLGAGGSWLLGTAGVLSGAVARSSYQNMSGSQLNMGYNWSNSRFDFAVNGMRASRGYRDVASIYSGPPPSVSASAQAGFNTVGMGSFGVSYVHLSYQQQTNRYASAYWFRSLNQRMSINFNINQNLGQPRDRSFFLGFNLSLDDRTYMSSQLQHDNAGNMAGVNVSRSVPSEGGLGWQAQLQQGNGTHSGRGELNYLGRYGQVQGGVSDNDGQRYVYASANGAVVLMAGGLFPTRSIYNGFAVVSTDGIANVPVKLENNLIGTTDQHGRLLIAPLNAYQNNKI
ncbi:MAG: fimbria/pilus outer membrane usher protein, partial [Rhodanobacter sp.]